MGIATLGEFKDLFRRAGVRTVYVKHLATKQDNEKNQVVLASEMNGLVNLFPARMALRAASQSRKKRNSSAGRPIAEAGLDFFWMDRTGARFHAPRRHCQRKRPVRGRPHMTAPARLEVGRGTGLQSDEAAGSGCTSSQRGG